MANSVSIIIAGRDAASNAFHSARHSLGELASKLTETKALIAEGIFGIGFLEVIKKTTEQFFEQEQAEARLNAVLAATGGAARLTSKEMIGLAEDLQKVTEFADDATIAAEAVLATFKNVKGDVFTAAVKGAQDMTVVFKGDLEGNIKKIGKALNDPVNGLKALSKAGIQFSDDQKAVIKALVETGDVAGAQNVVLGELAARCGGAAEAAGDTLAVQLKIAKHSLDDLEKSIGAALAPSLVALAGMFKDAADESVEFGKSADGTVSFIDDVSESVATLVDGLDALANAWKTASRVPTGIALATHKAEVNFRQGELDKARARGQIDVHEEKHALFQAQANFEQARKNYRWTLGLDQPHGGKSSGDIFREKIKENKDRNAKAKAKLAGMGGGLSGMSTGGEDDDDGDDEEGGAVIGKKHKDAIRDKAKAIVDAGRTAQQIFLDGEQALFAALDKGVVGTDEYMQGLAKLKDDLAKATADPLKKRADDLIKASRTAAETFHAEMDEFRKLRDKGLLAPGEFNRLAGLAKDKLDKASKDKDSKDKDAGSHELRGVPAIESRLLQNAHGRHGPGNVAQQTLAETKRANAMRERQAQVQAKLLKAAETTAEKLERFNLVNIS